MARIANKARGEVAVPELGDGFFIRFTVDALERLESKYDANEKGWLLTVIDGLSGMKMSVIRDCLDNSKADEARPDYEFLATGGGDLNSVCTKILDALFLILYRRTFEEQREHEEAKQLDEMNKRLEKINANPQMAALASLLQSGEQDISPASGPMKSAA